MGKEMNKKLIKIIAGITYTVGIVSAIFLTC